MTALFTPTQMTELVEDRRKEGPDPPHRDVGTACEPDAAA